MRKKVLALFISIVFAAGCSGAGNAGSGAATGPDAATGAQTAAAQSDASAAAQTGATETAQADTAQAASTGPQPSIQAAAAESGGPVTITDMKGREVTLTEPATRVIGLTADDCENLYAIGAGDTLVGRGEYCDYPPEVSNIPSVQSGTDTNLEQIIALKPQLLLMDTMNQTKEQVTALENAGITCVVLDAQDIGGVYTEIELLGELMGMQDNAEKVINDMKAGFAAVSADADKNKGKTVYFEVSPLQYGLWAAGSGTFMDEVAGMLGLTNCFSDVSGWAQISEEQVIARNPDYIVTISMYTGDGPKPDEEIMGRTGWDKITAVKNKAVLVLENNELSRPTYRLADGAKLLDEFVNGH